MKKKLFSIVLSFTMVMSMMMSMTLTAFAGEEDIFIPGDGKATTDLKPGENDFYEQEVKVSYQETDGDSFADKTYLVKLTFDNIPQTLTHLKGAKYVWVPEEKKYELDSSAGVASTYSLGEKPFTVTIENRSNVAVDYKVEYTPTNDPMLSEATITPATGNIGTIASSEYQSVVEDGRILITDTSAATTAIDAEYPSTSCEGTIQVTGVAKDKEAPSVGSLLTLGTIKVTIGENLSVNARTLKSLIASCEGLLTIEGTDQEFTGGVEGSNGFICGLAPASGSEKSIVIFSKTENNRVDEIPDFDKQIAVCDKDGKYVFEKGKNGSYTFVMNGDQLQSITWQSEVGSDTFVINKK